MALYFTKIQVGMGLTPESPMTSNEAGEFQLDSVTSKVNLHNGISRSPLVTESHDATLINKTIDVDLNTVTNIEDENIKVGADIDRAKIVATAPDHVIINDPSGVLSSEATLAKSRGGSGQDNSSITFPASGVLVTEAGTQTLTNKTIDADLNTLSNIENADIKVGANIDRTKTAAGSANHVLINNGSGVMSSEASLDETRGGTAQTTYITGDTLYATAADTLSKRSIGTAGDVLTVSGGVPVWQAPGASTTPTGVMDDYLGSSAPAGYILASGRTIGSGASAATERANDDTEALYTIFWNDYANSILAVSGGRGASAAADFAANKTIVVPDLRGRVSAGKDNMGGSTASRITVAGGNFDATVLGGSGGLQNHTLTATESGTTAHSHTSGTLSAVSNGAHTHTITGSFTGVDPGGGVALGNTGSSATSSNGAHTHTMTGSTAASIAASAASAHTILNPMWVTNKIIKL